MVLLMKSLLTKPFMLLPFDCSFRNDLIKSSNNTCDPNITLSVLYIYINRQQKLQIKYIDYTPISLKTFLAYISLFSVNIAFTKVEAGCLSCQTQSNKNNTHLRPSKKQQPEHDMYKQFVVTLLQKP